MSASIQYQRNDLAAQTGVLIRVRTLSRGSETPMERQSVRYGHLDLQQFAVASGDVNPLHVAPGYAHRTAYGEPVVYGVLGVLSCLAVVPVQRGDRLSRLTVDFPGPLFAEQDYSVEVEVAKPRVAKVRIRDGRRVLLRLSAHYLAGEATESSTESWSSCDPKPRAALLSDADLFPGRTLQGSYGPSASAIAILWERFRLEARGLSSLQVVALLWSSYLVGMELPGERALFSRLQLTFPPLVERNQGCLAYRATILANEDRFGLVSIDAQLGREGTPPLASAAISAFARRAASSRTVAPVSRVDLNGRVALVVGASRGLGAALARTLAACGCTVLGSFRHSSGEAQALADELSTGPGSFIPVQGDASLADVNKALRAQIMRDHGRLDFLICSACPPLRPLWIEPASLDRLLSYVSASLALAATPLCYLADLIEAQQGGVALISSSYVDDVPPEWPHYVAAKFALEGLARSVAAEFPRIRVVIARPPPLDTDFGNTPLAMTLKLSPEGAATAILNSLVHPQQSEPRPGFVDFPPPKETHATR